MKLLKEPTKWECINNLVGGGISGNLDGTNIVYLDGVTPPTEEEIETAWAKMKEDYKAQEYARSRADAYDPIPEQLDQIYHDMDGWKAKIKAVKDKYPKP